MHVMTRDVKQAMAPPPFLQSCNFLFTTEVNLWWMLGWVLYWGLLFGFFNMNNWLCLGQASAMHPICGNTGAIEGQYVVHLKAIVYQINLSVACSTLGLWTRLGHTGIMLWITCWKCLLSCIPTCSKMLGGQFCHSFLMRMWLFAVWGWQCNLHLGWIPAIGAGHGRELHAGWFIGVRSGTVPCQKEHNSPLVHILEVVECSLTK